MNILGYWTLEAKLRTPFNVSFGVTNLLECREVTPAAA